MNIYKGLLFLHGHLLHDDEAALQPGQENAGEAANDPVAPAGPVPLAKRGVFNVLESVLFLGGRPMHPDQPYDREEPFDQLLVGGNDRPYVPESRCA